MTDEEMDILSCKIEKLQRRKNTFHFNSFADELKIIGLILICRILFAILKEVKK